MSRNVVGTWRSRKTPSASPFASKCGTLYFPWSVGIRSSESGTSFLVSSSVDQIAWATPASFAAAAIAVACAFSRSGFMCSQNGVTQKAP